MAIRKNTPRTPNRSKPPKQGQLDKRLREYNKQLRKLGKRKSR